ncbi:hypothetical protein DCC61_01390 [Candidatus Microgenomates bacterium]|nr:MAG: hypothetical protein DCC61_01390 [Candidatus Microgenomates bacterium]
MFKKAPRKEDGLDLFARALGAKSGSDAILRQEADGQRSFVGSDTLPTEMSADDRTALEAAGVVFGEVVPGDDLFQYVQLPAGWTKRSTSHSMHNDLLDEKGRKRAGIFYKAAFYDRNAHLYCVRRFGINLDYDQLENGIVLVQVTDCDEVVYSTNPVPFEKSEERLAREQAFEVAKSWLNSNYPEWENAAAYWD